MKRDESQNVEYKESWHDKYLAWICGYANAQGGTIYFGIEDGTKKPVGVKNANSLMENIPNKIRDTMGIVADVALLRKNGKDVIRVKVKKSMFPVCYHGEYHYRTGAVKKEDMPVWFKNGMLAAVLAPTAVNQQRFFIDIDGENAVITAGRAPMSRIDLGIVRYNFKAASGHRCISE